MIFSKNMTSKKTGAENLLRQAAAASSKTQVTFNLTICPFNIVFLAVQNTAELNDRIKILLV